MKIALKSAKDLLIISPGNFQLRGEKIEIATGEDSKRILAKFDRNDIFYDQKIIFIPETGKITIKKGGKMKKPKKKKPPKKPKY